MCKLESFKVGGGVIGGVQDFCEVSGFDVVDFPDALGVEGIESVELGLCECC